MAKKKKGGIRRQDGGSFSPKALSQIYAKDVGRKLSSHNFCRDPYKALDHSPFIYMDILEALNRRYCREFKPAKILEMTVTRSSDYVDKAMCFIYPVVVKSEMFVFIEPNDYNKATYGLKIQKNFYSCIVGKVKEYFSGAMQNKRTTFPTFIQSLSGVISFKRFAHTTSPIWEQRIKDFIHLQ